MPDQDIFDTDNPAAPVDPAGAAATGDTPDLTDQLLSSITNESGEQKYASVPDALKGAQAAQAHIAKLEEELKVLRGQGNPTEKLDELLEAVKSKGSGQGESQDNASTMKPEDVLGIVKEYLSDTESAKQRQDNINTVANAFKSRYGKDASDKLYGKANDLGFNKDQINKLIAENANAALNVLGESKAASKPADPTASGAGVVSTSQFQAGSEDPHKGNIMKIQKSSDLVDAFNASKKRTLKRLGIES